MFEVEPAVGDGVQISCVVPCVLMCFVQHVAFSISVCPRLFLRFQYSLQDEGVSCPT